MAQIKTKLAYGVSGTLPTANIADDAVTAAKIADNAVVTAAINADAITSAKIADNAVVTAAINTDAITDAKIADDVVGTEHLTAGEVDQTAIADQAINEAKMQISNAPTNGYMLTAQSGNTGGMTWAEAGGGRLELISRSVNDDSGTSGGIDFNGCFTNAYRYYMLYIGKVAVETNQADLQVRFKDSSNNSLTGGYYNRGGEYNDVGSNSVGTNRAQGASSFILGPSSHNADNTPTHGSFFIYNSTHTTTNDRPHMTGTGVYHHEAQHDARMFYFGGSYVGGHHCAGLRIETSSGNISDHDFAIFGIKAY